jgi:hypothetical protein
MWRTWLIMIAFERRPRSVLDNFSSYPHRIHSWFIYIACSRRAPPRRLNQSAPAIVIISSGGLYRHCQYKISLLQPVGRQPGPVSAF